MACNRGVDYTNMLYQWQLYLLTAFVTDNWQDDTALTPIIELHQGALSGKEIDIQAWIDAQSQLDDIMQQMGRSFDMTYHLRRTAFLSASEVIDIDNIWISSAEAAVDAKVKVKMDTAAINYKYENKLRAAIWQEVMDDLLKMLKNWGKREI